MLCELLSKETVVAGAGSTRQLPFMKEAKGAERQLVNDSRKVVDFMWGVDRHDHPSGAASYVPANAFPTYSNFTETSFETPTSSIVTP
jgi:hypothetical protein